MDNVARNKHDLGIYASTVVMTVFYTIMAVLVYIVTHDASLKNDEYKVSIWYMLQSIVFYGVVSRVYTGARVCALWRALLPWRMTGRIGACWGINYVCILVAGSYMPNAIQAIFGQCQTVIVYIVNFHVFRNPLEWYHHAIVGSIVTFNLATAWGGTFTSDQGIQEIRSCN